MAHPYVLIGMNQFAHTNATDPKHSLISVGAADCIIVTAYNEATKSLLMCHVDRSTSVDWLFQQIPRIVGAPSYIILASDVFSRTGYEENGSYRAISAEMPENMTMRRIGARNFEFSAPAGRFWTGEMVQKKARDHFAGHNPGQPDISFSRGIRPEKIYPRATIATTSRGGAKESPF